MKSGIPSTFTAVGVSDNALIKFLSEVIQIVEILPVNPYYFWINLTVKWVTRLECMLYNI